MAFNQIFDYFYFFFYLLLLFLSFMSWRNNRQKQSYARWAFLITFIFVAFRAPVVGSDTPLYIKFLTGGSAYYSAEEDRELEFLFVLYHDIVSTITSSELLVMILNTIISMAPVLFLFKKYSYNVPLSILFFFYLHCQFVYFCALRQILGLSFILWGLIYYLHKTEHNSKILDICGFVCLFLCIGVGYGFHTSSIITGLLIFVLLLIPINNHIIYYVLILGSFFVGVIFKSFDSLSFLGSLYGFDASAIERISSYLVSEEENETAGVNILMRQSLIGIVSIYFMPDESRKHIFVKLCVAGVVIFNLFYNIPMISRFLPIFNIFTAICFTWIFRESQKKSIIKRHRANIVCILVVLYFTRSMLIEITNWDKEDFTRLHPYYFIFQDYSDHPALNSMKQ